MRGSGSLFALYKVPVSLPDGTRTVSSLMLEDPQSTDDFITHKLATELKVPSTSTSLYIRGLKYQYQHKPTKVYQLSLKDMAGTKNTVQAKGVNSLSEVGLAPEAKNLTKHFPDTEQGAKEAFDRDHGQVQVMLGMTLILQNCTDGLAAGNLRLNKTVFYPNRF